MCLGLYHFQKEGREEIMKLPRLIGSVLFMWLVMASMAFAEPECLAGGWAFGVYVAAHDSVQYYAEGPLNTWVTTGFIDDEGDFFQIDDQGFEGSAILFMVVRYEDGRPESRVPMRMVQGLCGFVGQARTDGNFVVFGNMDNLKDHYHGGVRLWGHPRP